MSNAWQPRDSNVAGTLHRALRTLRHRTATISRRDRDTSESSLHARPRSADCVIERSVRLRRDIARWVLTRGDVGRVRQVHRFGLERAIAGRSGTTSEVVRSNHSLDAVLASCATADVLDAIGAAWDDAPPSGPRGDRPVFIVSPDGRWADRDLTDAAIASALESAPPSIVILPVTVCGVPTGLDRLRAQDVLLVRDRHSLQGAAATATDRVLASDEIVVHLDAKRRLRDRSTRDAARAWCTAIAEQHRLPWGDDLVLPQLDLLVEGPDRSARSIGADLVDSAPLESPDVATRCALEVLRRARLVRTDSVRLAALAGLLGVQCELSRASGDRAAAAYRQTLWRFRSISLGAGSLCGRPPTPTR